MWCIPPKQNAEFVARMEDVLEVYSREFNEDIPVICMDEILLFNVFWEFVFHRLKP